MYPTMSELYRGSIRPYEHDHASDPDYRAALAEYCRVYKDIGAQLEKQLGQACHPLMDELAAAVARLSAEQERALFCEGLRLGVRLSAECFLPPRGEHTD